eukprot:gene14830-20883_t
MPAPECGTLAPCWDAGLGFNLILTQSQGPQLALVPSRRKVVRARHVGGPGLWGARGVRRLWGFVAGAVIGGFLGPRRGPRTGQGAAAIAKAERDQSEGKTGWSDRPSPGRSSSRGSEASGRSTKAPHTMAPCFSPGLGGLMVKPMPAWRSSPLGGGGGPGPAPPPPAAGAFVLWFFLVPILILPPSASPSGGGGGRPSRRARGVRRRPPQPYPAGVPPLRPFRVAGSGSRTSGGLDGKPPHHTVFSTPPSEQPWPRGASPARGVPRARPCPPGPTHPREPAGGGPRFPCPLSSSSPPHLTPSPSGRSSRRGSEASGAGDESSLTISVFQTQPLPDNSPLKATPIGDSASASSSALESSVAKGNR